jgi:hypothetical protein
MQRDQGKQNERTFERERHATTMLRNAPDMAEAHRQLPHRGCIARHGKMPVLTKRPQAATSAMGPKVEVKARRGDVCFTFERDIGSLIF